jgi:hypothetical protein
MDMAPDEIVVRYRQAKHKGEQIKILADLNACSIEDILKVLVDHGGYELARISRAIGAARKSDAPKKVQKPKKQIAYKKPEIIPEPPKQEPEPAKEPEKEKIPPVVKRALESETAYLANEIEARRNRIEELEAEITEFQKDIAALRAWEEEHT